jgi:hypothetical protein
LHIRETTGHQGRQDGMRRGGQRRSVEQGHRSDHDLDFSGHVSYVHYDLCCLAAV